MPQAKPLQEGVYVVGNLPTKSILVTGLASIENVEVGVLDSDTGSADITKRCDNTNMHHRNEYVFF